MSSVSLVIPTINGGERFLAVLDALKKQTVKPSTILIIDSGSTDGTPELAKGRGCRIIRINRHDFDHGTTRNLGVANTECELIVFLTQDALPYDECTLENIVRPFDNDSKIGAAFGKQLPYPDASIFAEHLRLFNYPDTSYTRVLDDRKNYGIKTAFLSNSFAAYRRPVLEEIGYFKSGLLFGEDACTAAKILLKGYKIAYVAEAIVLHSHNYTAWQDFRRYFDMGAFHRTENWLLKEFGKAEGEGIKYVKSEIKFLLKKRRFDLFPEFTLRIIMKHLGYKLGRQYIHLPESISKRFSMNQEWWDKRNKPY